jgi:hypothetical protein
MARCDWCDQTAKHIGLSFGGIHVCVDCCACGVTIEKTMSRVGLCRDCGYPAGYTRRLEDELRAAQLELAELRRSALASIDRIRLHDASWDADHVRLRDERDAWSEEAGRRGLALATVEARYAALLEVCAEFARGNREGT